jgi:hypothetical protein
MLSSRSSIPLGITLLLLVCIHYTQAQTRFRPSCSSNYEPFFWKEWTEERECPEWAPERAQQFCSTGLPNKNWLCPHQRCTCDWYAYEDPEIYGHIDPEDAQSGLVCTPAPIDLELHPQATTLPQYQMAYRTAQVASDWYCMNTCTCAKPTRRQWAKIGADYLKEGADPFDGGYSFGGQDQVKQEAFEDCSDNESVGSTCGIVCRGQINCERGYSCVVQSLTMAPSHFKVGRFLALCTAVKMMRLHPDLGARGLEDGKWCACNATYLAEACCGSTNGLIWDVPDGKGMVVQHGTHEGEDLVDIPRRV